MHSIKLYYYEAIVRVKRERERERERESERRCVRKRETMQQ